MSRRAHGGHRRAEAERDLVLQVIAQMRRLAAATNEWQRREMEAGFTIHQALVLHHLVSHGDATPSDLAAWMHITRGSVTPVVKRLEDLGLVARRTDEQDARKQWLSATPEARDIAREVEAQALRPIFSVFASWSAADLARFSQDLERLLASPLLGGGP